MPNRNVKVSFVVDSRANAGLGVLCLGIALAAIGCTTDFGKYRFDQTGVEGKAGPAADGGGAGERASERNNAMTAAGGETAKDMRADAALPKDAGQTKDAAQPADAGPDEPHDAASPGSQPMPDQAGSAGRDAPAGSGGRAGSLGAAGAAGIAADGAAGSAAAAAGAGGRASPQNCTPVWPIDADAPLGTGGIKICRGAGGESPATGENAANWFNYLDCGAWKNFEVMPGIPIRIVAQTDQSSCSGCVLTRIHYEVQEQEVAAGPWIAQTTVDYPNGFDMLHTDEYTPRTAEVRIQALNLAAFYLDVVTCR